MIPSLPTRTSALVALCCLCLLAGPNAPTAGRANVQPAEATAQPAPAEASPPRATAKLSTPSVPPLLELGPGVPVGHPLVPVIESIASGRAGLQPDWKLPLLINALDEKPVMATLTSYCDRCSDGGGMRTRWGSRLRRGICAADPKYWGPGSVIWLGGPINEIVVVEDTGGAIKGPYRFDYCAYGNHGICCAIGRSKILSVPLRRVPPRKRWGEKPAGWEPPVVEADPALCRLSEAARIAARTGAPAVAGSGRAHRRASIGTAPEEATGSEAKPGAPTQPSR